MRLRHKRVQSIKKDGLWIQCCNEKCQKWRFVSEYFDPLSVPEIWICSQNLDEKFSSCEVPEDKYDENLIESKYILGTVVWAKIKGFPWWPGIIDDSPETQTFYELRGSNVPVKYHVTFFGPGEVEREWVKPINIKPFKEDDGELQPIKKPKIVFADMDFSESLHASLEITKSAIAMDVPERLKNYSFAARFNQRRPEDLQVDIYRNIEKRAGSCKRVKRSMTRLRYVNGKIGTELNCTGIKQLPNSPQSKQITSVVPFKQRVINPQRWNICTIQ